MGAPSGRRIVLAAGASAVAAAALAVVLVLARAGGRADGARELAGSHAADREAASPPHSPRLDPPAEPERAAEPGDEPAAERPEPATPDGAAAAALPAALDLEVVVVSAFGGALRNAWVRSSGRARDEAFTDATGACRLRAAPDGTLGVQADDHWNLSVPVAAVLDSLDGGAARATVVMDPLNRLVLRLPLLEPCCRALLPRLRFFRSDGSEREPGHTAVDGWSDDAIPPGRELRLSLRDALGTLGCELVVAPLDKSEQREETLPRPPECSVVHLMVVDEAGRPVERAFVETGGDDSPRAGTDGAGRVCLGPFFGRLPSLLLWGEGYATRPLPTLDASTHAQPFVVELEREREVWMRVEGGLEQGVATGAARATARLWGVGSDVSALTAHGEFDVYAELGEGSRQRLLGVPRGDVTLALDLAGRSYPSFLPAGESEVVFTVPVLGSIEARWAHPPPRSYHGMQAVLRPCDGDGPGLDDRCTRDAGCDFPSVAPGRWELRVIAFHGGSPEDEVLGTGPIEVIVRSGAVSRIDLEPR